MSRTFRKNPKNGIVYQDKDRRKGAIRFDRTCLSHGGCPYCESNRLHNFRKKKFWSLADLLESDGERLHRRIH
jgi:hypothetical protein